MKGKILIVDDHEGIRTMLKTVLAEHNQVTEAESGAELQKAYSQEQPDVVLLDVKLPDANGLELLPSIKKRWPETEVIILTGRRTTMRPSPGPSRPPNGAPSIFCANPAISTSRN